MADQAEGAPQTTDTQQEAPAPVSTDALMGRLDELASQVQSLVPPQPQAPTQSLADSVAQPADAQQGQEPGFDPNAWDQYDQGYEPGQYDQQYQQLDPQQAQQQAAQDLQQYIGTQIQQGVQSHMEPFMRQQRAIQLENQYPDLKNPEIVGKVMQDAQMRAQRAGRPELATNPEFIELTYLAQQASHQASQQTAAEGEKDVHLEGAGAQPAPEQEDDFAARVVAAGPQRNGFGWT